MKEESLLKFINREVRAKFRDGSHIKTAEGRLDSINDGFVKIIGIKGTLVINRRNIIDVQ